MIRFYCSSFAHCKKKKILSLVYSLEENLKWNILFFSQYQDLYFISFSTKFTPCYTSFSILEDMILIEFDPPRIFISTKLNYSVLHCFNILFRTKESNTTWKPCILSQISTYKRTWNYLILCSFIDFTPDAFHFIDSPKTSISSCISAPLCPMII